MRFGQRILLILSIVLLSALPMPLLQGICHAASIAALRTVSGAVDIMRNGALPAIAAKNGDQLSAGDLLRTKTNAFAEVVYHDGTILKVAPRSRIDIGEHFSGNNPNGSEVKLARGKVQAIVELSKAPGGSGAKKFEVRTPNAIAGVRGTSFIVSHQQGVTGILVHSGSVYSLNPRLPSQIVNLSPGTVTTISGNTPPSPPRPAQGNEVQRMEQGLTPPSGSGASSTAPPVSPASPAAGPQTGDTSNTGAPLFNIPAAPSPTASNGTPSAIDNQLISNITSRQGTENSPIRTVVSPPPPPPVALPATVGVKVRVNF